MSYRRRRTPNWEEMRRLDEKRLFADKMRKNPTPAEAALWIELRNSARGARFTRQALLWGWIVDFYAPKKRVAIEVDGSSHDSDAAAERDERKDTSLESHGICVVRVKNVDVFLNLAETLDQIDEALST